MVRKDCLSLIKTSFFQPTSVMDDVNFEHKILNFKSKFTKVLI